MTLRRCLLQSVITAAILSSLTGCYRASEATVNGIPITQEEFRAALMLSQGQQMLYKLSLQKLILAEAATQGIQLKDDEIRPFLKKITDNVSQPDMIQAMENEVRSRLLLKRLLLHGVSEEQLQEFYQNFKQELTLHKVYAISTENQKEAQLVVDELLRGLEPERVAAAHSKSLRDRKSDCLQGYLTMGAIRDRWGSDMAFQIQLPAAKGLAGPRQQPNGFLVLFLAESKGSFEDVKSSIENLIADSKRPELIYRLLSKANITSPHLLDPKRLPQTDLYSEEALPWEVHDRIQPEALPETSVREATSIPSVSTSPTSEPDLLLE